MGGRREPRAVRASFLFFLLETDGDDAAAAVGVDDDDVRTILVVPVDDDVVRDDGPTILDIPVSSVLETVHSDVFFCGTHLLQSRILSRDGLGGR